MRRDLFDAKTWPTYRRLRGMGTVAAGVLHDIDRPLRLPLRRRPEAMHSGTVAYVRFASSIPSPKPRPSSPTCPASPSRCSTPSAFSYGHIAEPMATPSYRCRRQRRGIISPPWPNTVGAVLAAADLAGSAASSSEIRTLGPQRDASRRARHRGRLGPRTDSTMLHPTDRHDEAGSTPSTPFSMPQPVARPVNLPTRSTRDAADAMERSWTHERQRGSTRSAARTDPDALFPMEGTARRRRSESMSSSAGRRASGNSGDPVAESRVSYVRGSRPGQPMKTASSATAECSSELPAAIERSAL